MLIRPIVQMFRIETMNPRMCAVLLTAAQINIRVNSIMRGNFFLSTPGPDEHPRSAPFDCNVPTWSARVPADKRLYRKLTLRMELINGFTCAGLPK
jgi:hypothetical protein